MEHPGDVSRPEPARDLPATSRNLTTDELEAVIRRAVELQAGSSARTDEGLAEAEVVRIGQELGLQPATVRRAIAEVRGRPAAESGALVTVAGPRTIRASRVLRRPAAECGRLVDRHLREAELMVVQRRFPDRTRYVRNASLAAGLTRFTRAFTQSQPSLDMKQLDVAVAALERDTCLLEVSADLTGVRAGLVAGVLGGGSGLAAGWAVIAWVTAIADPLMLIGLPAVAGAWYGTRAIYGAVRQSAHEKLEAFLDRVEHDELTRP